MTKSRFKKVPSPLRQLDPYTPPLPLQEKLLTWRLDPNRPLRVGVMTSNGYVTPTPSAQRAIKLAAEALAKHAGVVLVPFSPPEAELAWLLSISVLWRPRGLVQAGARATRRTAAFPAH